MDMDTRNLAFLARVLKALLALLCWRRLRFLVDVAIVIPLLCVVLLERILIALQLGLRHSRLMFAVVVHRFPPFVVVRVCLPSISRAKNSTASFFLVSKNGNRQANGTFCLHCKEYDVSTL